DGEGTNYQFINGNNVTTISQGKDGTSSAVITNHNNSGAAVSSTYYNSQGHDIGAALFDEVTGEMTTYNRCGQVGRPGESCTWTNPDTGEQVHVD
ncbi:MAG: hypothetical protein K2X47_15920, partial [Bdellovibrionales bacterium]|nr:hypothetical protein [Bdellovibrionales bacterium]